MHSTARGQVALTAAGEDLLPSARRFVTAASDLYGAERPIRLSTYPAIAALVAQVPPSLTERSPGLVFADIDEGQRSDAGRGLLQALHELAVDLVIAPEGMDDDDVSSVPVYNWALRVVLPVDAALPGAPANTESVSPQELRRYNVAVAPEGHRSRALVERAYANAGVSLSVSVVSSNETFLWQVARNSRSTVAIIPDDAFGGLFLPRDIGPLLTDRSRPVGGRYALYTRAAEGALAPRDRTIEELASVIADHLTQPR